MFGLTFEKLLIIGVVATFIIGPQRLPAYATKLANLVKAARALVDTAKIRIATEIGPDFGDVDWKTLDPRQYDPRRIIQDALAEEPSPQSDAPVTTGSDHVQKPQDAPILASSQPNGGWQTALLARVGT